MDACKHVCVCESSPLCLRLVVLVVATKVVGVFGLVQSTVVLLVVLEENTGATPLTWIVYILPPCYTSCYKDILDWLPYNMCLMGILSPSCCGSDHTHTHTDAIEYMCVHMYMNSNILVCIFILYIRACTWIFQGIQILRPKFWGWILAFV